MKGRAVKEKYEGRRFMKGDYHSTGELDLEEGSLGIA
jgi:hypothetical protein